MKLNPHHQKTFLGDISSFRLVIANGDDEERCITATWLNAKGAPVGMDVQTEFCQIAFQSPPLKQMDAFWEQFSPKIRKYVKTAILTLGIDILTMTMVKLFS